MKDIFEAYKRQRIKKNLIIISSALAFALFVNVFLFKTDMGNKLQTSVVNFNSEEKTSSSATKDMFLTSEKTGTNLLDLYLGTDLQ